MNKTTGIKIGLTTLGIFSSIIEGEKCFSSNHDHACLSSACRIPSHRNFNFKRKGDFQQGLGREGSREVYKWTHSSDNNKWARRTKSVKLWAFIEILLISCSHKTEMLKHVSNYIRQVQIFRKQFSVLLESTFYMLF